MAGRRFSRPKRPDCARCPHESDFMLKPTSDRQAQVVLMGQVATSMDAMSYHQYKPRLRKQILAVYQSLAESMRRWCWKAPAVRRRQPARPRCRQYGHGNRWRNAR